MGEIAQIGLQLYSLKDFTEKDFLGTLEKVAQAGYDGVEFAGYFNTPSNELKKTLDDLDLKAAGSHIGIDDLEQNLNKMIEYSLELNSPYIICPGLPEVYRNSAHAYKRTAELFNQIGESCRNSGLQFGYHNHHVEFERYDGEYGLDILVNHTEKENLFIELDTYWAEVCGIKSIDLIEKYKQRCKVLHIKDMNNFEVKRNVEIGKGAMDFEEIVNAGKAQQVEWYTVEQENFDKDPLVSIQESFQYLKSIL
ncbi:sugar phosphate isomerase [Halobacillus andaensis]|uniref:Sugar phosphate isomerase n=1 Tax=Halobacillus andaensis TaxID=1176239 RepID=A0A917B8A4_HALAA|nr:sugar phosphate isomerase/epimerase [Halobacillus andaensis]MBP2005221.1 sugar phosphate isomerase/epimerase [Halobacillus andaensis]GGF29784.1 sugar phosphate isomerase [Halobacillus andaensis]